MLVPCAEVINKPIVNYTTLGRRRTTLAVGISYDADPQAVCDLLQPVVAGVAGVVRSALRASSSVRATLTT